MPDKFEAINSLIDVFESEPDQDQAGDALAIARLLMNDGKPEEGCLNHAADSWGCCENCGCMVF